MLNLTMHTTNQILDAISAKHGGVTDYRLSKFFETSTQTVGNWRHGRTALSLDYAHKAAELLAWEPAYVVACVEHERAQKDARLEATDEIKATWEKIAQAFRPAAAILAVFMLLGLTTPSTSYGRESARIGTVDLYIMRSGRRFRRPASGRWEWFASFLEYFRFRDALHFGRVMPVELATELSP